jgi:hypothetical protein
MTHTICMPRTTRPARPGMIRSFLSDALGLACIALMTAVSLAVLHDLASAPVLPV